MSREIIKLLLDGFFLCKDGVTICKLDGVKKRYQVFSDNYSCKCCHFYNMDELDIAVDKFLLVLGQVSVKKPNKQVSSLSAL